MLEDRQNNIARANLATAWVHMLQAAAGLLPECDALDEWNTAMRALGTPSDLLKNSTQLLILRKNQETLSFEEDSLAPLTSYGSLLTDHTGGVH
jgi:hypothetical protein